MPELSRLYQFVERDPQSLREPGGDGQRGLAFVLFELRQITLRNPRRFRDDHLRCAASFLRSCNGKIRFHFAPSAARCVSNQATISSVAFLASSPWKP